MKNPLKALANILSELFFQLRTSGDRGTRFWYVFSFYHFYLQGRRAGLGQEESRRRSLQTLCDRGFLRKFVTVRWPDGMRLQSDVFSACFVFKEIAGDGIYEKRPSFVAKPGQTVVDVGAHHGFYTLLAASRVGPRGRVIAIEVMPENLSLLRKNVETNKLSQVSIADLAAAESAGQAAFHIPKNDMVGSLVYDSADSRTITVSKDTLDHILKKAGAEHVDLIKIDVEGACLSVLMGARETLRQKPRLVMEVEGGEADMAKVRRFVEDLGYTTHTDASIIYAQA
jgi:FkbM family methyltransferase